ncbi:MAG: M36 family metallopeptidase [Gilvibacter sp.]
MKNCTLALAFVLSCLCSVATHAQDFNGSIANYFNQQKENHNLDSQDLQFVITSQSTSKVSGITHVYFTQTVNGIPVTGTESSMHFDASQKVIKVNNHLVSNANTKAAMSSPSLTPSQAVESAASQLGYAMTKTLSTVSSSKDGSNSLVLSDGGISQRDIPVALTYQKLENGQLALSWDLSILELASQNWWSVRVDAATGQIVDRVNWMSSCNFEHDHSLHEDLINYNTNLQPQPNYGKTADELGCSECYEVIAMPLETPGHGTRTIENDPAFGVASPFGWHDTNGAAGAEFTTTRGNNVNAYEDGDNAGYQPDGGSGLEFYGTGFEFNPVYSGGDQSEAAAITNLFYWNNIIHDVLFVYGFDSPGGNFQENTYGLGGAGSDSVNAEAQDGSGTCNANFGTPPDGGNPQMQMYVCGSRDGDFDNMVVVHEYGHGISNRLTGGPGAAGCLGNAEQMGEGWSDWYGAIMTIEPGDDGSDSRGVGTWLIGEGPDGDGIRPFPYSTDTNINPQTYSYISSSAIPHGVGSVWCTALWEVTWALIDEHGFDTNIYNFTGDASSDAGNVMAMALVTEAMKLQPCSPGFVDGRDAIFAADAAIYGGANECLLWDAFAKRGLGINADQGSSGSTTDGTEDFESPSGSATFSAPDDVCASEEVLEGLGGGSPFGGVYSGPGVTDNGDGATYSFDPSAAGVGMHTISYEVTDGACSVASSASDEIEVLDVPDQPTTTGAEDFCVGDEVTVSAVPNDGANVIRWFDSEFGGTFLHQGNDYTFTPTGSQDLWAQETPDDELSKLVISEVTLETPDRLEIMNAGVAADYSGYIVAVSEEPFTNINTVNSVTKTLGAMDEDEAIAWSDSTGDNYWGSNIWWDNDAGETGWILILDPDGNVVDSSFWNATAAQIATFDVTISGFNITAADLDWVGIGADLTAECNDSFQRTGDSDTALDWSGDCLDATYGEPNENIGIGFAGCLSNRVLTQVVAEDEDPSLTCPDDQFFTITDGEPYMIPDYAGSATVSDNCPDGLVVTQDPAAGTEVGPGEYTIALIATDAAGNAVDCTFTLTVDGVLSVADVGLNNVFTLYPNPTQGDMVLRNRGNVEIDGLKLFDMNGRLIKVFNTNSTSAEITLPMGDVATGMYFVQVTTDQGQTVKRVIKE